MSLPLLDGRDACRQSKAISYSKGVATILPNLLNQDPARPRARLKSQLSLYGKRANERANEAHCHFEKPPSEEEEDRNPGAGAGSNDIGFALARFDDITKGIDALQRGGGDVDTAILRSGQPISEDLPARGQRIYRVPLPHRPAQVKVSFTCENGTVQLLGSTEHAKPNAKACEYRSKEDLTLTYNHVLEPDDNDCTIDRTKAVPKARDLFICALNLAGDCKFTIDVAFAAARIVLTRAEVAARVMKLRRGYESRIEELQRDVSMRAEFDERCQNLQEEYGLKGEILRKNDIVRHTGKPKKDIIGENRATMLKANSPEARYRRMLTKALERCQREDERIERLSEANTSRSCFSTRDVTSTDFFLTSAEPVNLSLE